MTGPEAIEPKLTERFNDAFQFAGSLHRWQLRKGTDVPYLAHLMGVASLVLADGGDEDEAIAALLHDAVEEQGGIPTLNEIRRRYGDRVATIVEQCTDHDPAKDRPEWHIRKRAYIDSLPDRRACHRVALGDKLENARALLADYRRVGEAVWRRYSAGREQLLYHRALADTFLELSKSPLAHEYDQVVRELERMAAASQPEPQPAGVGPPTFGASRLR
jgi:(p)ppGpp synthase/HD superfamily hydrolase